MKPKDTASKPNILVIYTDQQRWDALAANGNPDIQTPHLDRLAARSANFDHCFVQNPVCMPSRASFLTGRYPSTLGITHMGVPMPEDIPNFATLFGAYGYHCANIGKLHFLPHANRDHTRPHPPYGFHHLEISDEPGVYEDAYRAWARQRAPDQLDHLSAGLPPARKTWLDAMEWHDSVKHPPCETPDTGRFDFGGPIAFPGSDDVTHSAFVGHRVDDYLRARSRASAPFACIAGFYSPHSPWLVPQTYLDQYDADQITLPDMPEQSPSPQSADADTQVAAPPSTEHLRAARHGYYAMVSEVDAYVGRLLDTLDETGQADNTVVVFTSDHGEWLGEHGKWGKGYPAHDACSRVPLLISAPGVAGQTLSQLVESVDVLPTLLELAGLPVPTFLQGRSLVPALRGKSEGRHNALTEHHGWRSLRTDSFRYVAQADGQEELYDLSKPCGAYFDVSSSSEYKCDLSDLRHQLATRLIDNHQPRQRSWPY